MTDGLNTIVIRPIVPRIVPRVGVLAPGETAGRVVVRPQRLTVSAAGPRAVVVRVTPAVEPAPLPAERLMLRLQPRTVVRAAGGGAGPQGPPGDPGAPGPPGPPGPTGQQTYVHTQAIPAAVWTVAHALGRYPSVTVVDSAGTVVIGNVVYTSADIVTLTFASAFGGAAYLN